MSNYSRQFRAQTPRNRDPEELATEITEASEMERKRDGEIERRRDRGMWRQKSVCLSVSAVPPSLRFSVSASLWQAGESYESFTTNSYGSSFAPCHHSRGSGPMGRGLSGEIQARFEWRVFHGRAIRVGDRRPRNHSHDAGQRWGMASAKPQSQ